MGKSTITRAPSHVVSPCFPLPTQIDLTQSDGLDGARGEGDLRTLLIRVPPWPVHEEAYHHELLQAVAEKPGPHPVQEGKGGLFALRGKTSLPYVLAHLESQAHVREVHGLYESGFRHAERNVSRRQVHLHDT